MGRVGGVGRTRRNSPPSPPSPHTPQLIGGLGRSSPGEKWRKSKGLQLGFHWSAT
ncbi:MAG: hypothetical protein F6J93_28220 [Oscillatoria sp. SIO1A7]|nr:hypothetical protein [Oscillatoria sp. SIO1A7]